jgi:hypothetical protein
MIFTYDGTRYKLWFGYGREGRRARDLRDVIWAFIARYEKDAPVIFAAKARRRPSERFDKRLARLYAMKALNGAMQRSEVRQDRSFRRAVWQAYLNRKHKLAAPAAETGA